MARRLLWEVLGLPPPAPRRPIPGTVSAAAASVSLARPRGAGGRIGTGGYPWQGGPPLEPFTYAAPPWWDRDAAMSIPTIARSRNLICSTIGQLPFTYWRVDPTSVPVVEQRQIGPSWAARPDPDRTRQWLLSWTADDLYFTGRAHWLVLSRYADTFPASFRRIPPGDLTASGGTLTYTDPATGERTAVDPYDVIEFLSPDDGLLDKGWRAISIALQLDAAADRFAGTEVPAGVLEEQDLNQEDISGDELAEMAAQFTAARQSNTTAATNRYVKYREVPYDASKMQLVEARTYQALELARVGDVPPYLVGAPAGTGMTYQNGQQARQDLVDFGAQTYITCIEQTLSGPNVTPRNMAVRLDLNVWLRNPFTTDAQVSPTDLEVTDPTAPAPSPPATEVVR